MSSVSFDFPLWLMLGFLIGEAWIISVPIGALLILLSVSSGGNVVGRTLVGLIAWLW